MKHVAAVLLIFAICALPETIAVSTYKKPRLTIPSQKIIVFQVRKREIATVKKRLTADITAYYGPKPGQRRYVCKSLAADIRLNGAGKETRDGSTPKIGTAAANWKILPRGTKFRVPGCGFQFGNEKSKPMNEFIFTIQDTGAAMKDTRKIHIDIFMGFGDPGRAAAEKFGRRTLAVEVIETTEAVEWLPLAIIERPVS